MKKKMLGAAILAVVFANSCASGKPIPHAKKSKLLHGKSTGGFGVKSFEIEELPSLGGHSIQRTFYVTQVGNFDESGYLQGKGFEYFGKSWPRETNNGEPYLSGNVLQDPGILEKYSGDFKNGVKEGEGVAELYSSRQVFERYNGNFRNGFPNGKGKFERYGFNRDGISHSPTKGVTQYYYGFFRNGFFHGPAQWKEYDREGNLLHESYGFYAFGKPEGAHVTFAPNADRKNGSVYDKIANKKLQISSEEFWALFDASTIDALSDTIEVGHRNNSGLLQGYGYRINREGEFQVGYFNDGRLHGYGLQFRNLHEHKGFVKSETVELVELRSGNWVDGKIHEGVMQRFGNRQRTGSSFPHEHVQSGNEGKMLGFCLETFDGKFDANELFTGWGVYTYDETDRIVTNKSNSLSRGSKYTFHGNFKQGKYHGPGKLITDSSGVKTEVSAIYEMGVLQKIESEKTRHTFAGLSYGDVVEIDGIPGMVDKALVLEKTTIDGRKFRENGKIVIRKGMNPDFLFHACPVCRGKGTISGTCKYTASTVTGFRESRQVFTMGQNTYIEKTYTPQYRTSSTDYPCEHSCAKCQGDKKRFPKTTAELRKEFGKK